MTIHQPHNYHLFHYITFTPQRTAHALRVYDIGGEPHFLMRDILHTLGYTESASGWESLAGERTIVYAHNRNNRVVPMRALTIAGTRQLLDRSRKAEAYNLRQFIETHILPSWGMHDADTAEVTPQALRELCQARKDRTTFRKMYIDACQALEDVRLHNGRMLEENGRLRRELDSRKASVIDMRKQVSERAEVQRQQRQEITDLTAALGHSRDLHGSTLTELDACKEELARVTALSDERARALLEARREVMMHESLHGKLGAPIELERETVGTPETAGTTLVQRALRAVGVRK